MKTQTVGEMLQQYREESGWSLAELAQRSRIRADYLSALEKNDFQALPAAPFVRGYIKTYGHYFDFDHLPLLALLRRDFKESAKGTLVPREFLKPVLSQSKGWSLSRWIMIGVASIFLSLLSYVGVQWWRFQQPPQLAVSQPLEGDTVAAQVEVVGKTETDATVTINAQPVSLQQNGDFTSEIFIPREGLATITIISKDDRGKATTVQRTVRVEF